MQTREQYQTPRGVSPGYGLANHHGQSAPKGVQTTQETGSRTLTQNFSYPNLPTSQSTTYQKPIGGAMATGSGYYPGNVGHSYTPTSTPQLLQGQHPYSARSHTQSNQIMESARSLQSNIRGVREQTPTAVSISQVRPVAPNTTIQASAANTQLPHSTTVRGYSTERSNNQTPQQLPHSFLGGLAYASNQTTGFEAFESHRTDKSQQESVGGGWVNPLKLQALDNTAATNPTGVSEFEKIISRMSSSNDAIKNLVQENERLIATAQEFKKGLDRRTSEYDELKREVITLREELRRRDQRGHTQVSTGFPLEDKIQLLSLIENQRAEIDRLQHELKKNVKTTDSVGRDNPFVTRVTPLPEVQEETSVITKDVQPIEELATTEAPKKKKKSKKDSAKLDQLDEENFTTPAEKPAKKKKKKTVATDDNTVV